jgi:hypothetical protein
MEKKAGALADNAARRRSWMILPLVFFVMLAAVSLLLHIEKARRQKKVLEENERFSALLRARPIEEARAERARFYSTRYYLGYPAASSYAISDFIRRLGDVFQPRQLLRVQIEPGAQNFDFRLTVGIAAGAPGSALWRFTVLFDKLQEFQDITQVSFSEESPVDVIGSGRVQVFTITGRAELP